MRVYVLFKCHSDEHVIEYRVLEESEFEMMKLCERNLCARTVTTSIDDESLNKVAKELNTLVKEFI